MTPEQELKERVKALIAADAKGAAPQKAPIYEATPATAVYEKQYTKATGKTPFTQLDPQAQNKEVIKAKVKTMIMDDMSKDLPPEMKAKLGWDTPLQVERGTLAEERRLRQPTKEGSTAPGVATLMDQMDPFPARTALLEKERRGERLSTAEHAMLTAWHTGHKFLDVASAGVLPSWEQPVPKSQRVDYQPQGAIEKVGAGLGSLGGMMTPGGVPHAVGAAFAKGIANPAITKIAATKLTPKLKSVIIRAVRGAGLGPVMAAANADESEGIKDLPSELVSGVLLGEIFAGAGAIVPKNKALGFLLRNTATRALSGAAGQYDASFIRGLKKGIDTGNWDDVTVQGVIDEALLSWFSAKGTTGKDIAEIVPKLKAAEKAQAEGKARNDAIGKAISDKYKGEMGEAKGLADIKVNPDIVKLGEKLATFDSVKNIPGAPSKQLQKLRVEIVDLYKKIRGGMREGEAMPEEVVALGKYQQRVPGMAEQPKPAPAPATAPAAQAPTAKPQGAKPYTTTVTTTAKPKGEVEKTPVVPPAMLPDLHTPDHYVYDGTTFQKTEGKDVDIVPDVDTFLHRGGSGAKRTWVVIEGKSGVPIGIDTTQEGAIKMAKAAIGQPNFPDLIKDAVAKSGSSPRYVQAEGAGTMGMIVTDVPPEMEAIEQRILAKAPEAKGGGTLGDPIRITGDPETWFNANKAASFIEEGAYQKKPGFQADASGTKVRKVVRRIRRPYGYLENTGGDRWQMVVEPGFDMESLKKAPAGEAPKPVATTGAKEPWQMTRGEFINKRGANAPMESDNFAIHHLSSVEDGKPGLSVEGDKIIVRNEAGSPIGVTTLKTIGGQKVTDSTAVHPGNRRQGVATQLYAKAKELGYDTGYVENVASAGAKHKLAVQQALSEGKSVPPEVLADYPDLAPTAPAPDATKLNSLLQQEQTPGEKALAGAKGTKKAPLTAGRREHLARQLNEQAAREEAALDPELFKAEHGYPAEMASPADIAKFRAAKKGGLKGLTVEEVNWVMADAAEKGREIRGGFYGYVRDKAKQEAPPPIPDKGESPMEVKKPTEKTWFVGMKVTNNLKRMGAGGMKAAQGIMEYSRKRMQWTQRDLYGAANVATIVESNTEVGQQARPGKLNIGPRKANNAERAVQTGKRMRELIERKIQPADEVEARAVELIRTRLDEIAKDAEALGVKVSGVYGEKKWRSVKDYYPHEWLGLEELWEGEIHHNMKDVIVEKIAKEHFGPLYNDPATKAKAMETAGKYWDDFRNDLKTARYGHLEMQRILDDEFVETLRKRWEAKFPDKPFPLRLNEDISVLFRYLAGANNRIAWLQEFGKDEAYKGWMVPEKVLEWSREMENPENRKWMYNRFSDILRRGGEGKWQKLSNTIQTFQLAKMTFASLPNMWQWATNTVPNMTSKAAIEAIWDTAKFFGAAGPEAKKQAREFFSETGAGRMSADMQAAMATHPQKYAAIADIMLKGYGFTGTEFYNRLYSSFAGKRYAEHLAEKLQKSGEMGWRSPQYIAELKKLGLDAADVERLIKDGPLTKENVEKLAEAGYNMTRITQFMTDNFFLPSTWANPGVRILTQFKNFAYNQTSLLYNEPIKQAANFIKSGAKRAITGKGEITGDLTPLLKTAAILPVAGAIVYHLKKEMYKDLGITFYEKMLAGKSEPLKWFSYIFNAGGFGIGSDIVTSVAMGKAGIANLVGGPTVSDLAELSDAVMKTWGDLSKGGKWAAHRKESIGGYWARFGGRLSPTARVIMSQFSGEYKKVTSFNQWSRLVRDFYRKYKETYMLESPAVAEEIWQGFMETQGKDYEEATAKMGQRRKLQKPTRREIKAWWDEMGAAPSERVPMPGKKQRDLGEFYY